MAWKKRERWSVEKERRGGTRLELTERVKVATKAQTKLLHIVLLVKLWLISCSRSKTRVSSEHSKQSKGKTNLDGEQNSSDRRTEGDGDSSSTGSGEDLPHLSCKRRTRVRCSSRNVRAKLKLTMTPSESLKVASNDVPDATRDVHRRSFFSDRET